MYYCVLNRREVLTVMNEFGNKIKLIGKKNGFFRRIFER